MSELSQQTGAVVPASSLVLHSSPRSGPSSDMLSSELVSSVPITTTSRKQRLPNEVIYQIINSLVPLKSGSVALAPWHSTTKTLLSFVLVSHSTSQEAQKLLYANCLYVDSAKRLQQISAAVTKLKLRSPNADTQSQLHTLPCLALYQHIRFLHLCPYRLSSVNAFTMALLSYHEAFLTLVGPTLHHLILSIPADAEYMTRSVSVFWNAICTIWQHHMLLEAQKRLDGGESTSEERPAQFPVVQQFVVEMMPALKCLAIQTTEGEAKYRETRQEGVSCLERFDIAGSCGEDEKVAEVPGAREVRFILAEVGESKAQGDGFAQVRRERKYGLQVRVVDVLCGGGGEKEDFIRWRFNSALSGWKGFEY